MTPLIDADILLHELGWSGEFKDKETEEMVMLSSEHVLELLDEKIRGICIDVDADEEPILFVTNSEWVTNYLNKVGKWQGGEPCYFVPNFRYDVAVTKPYKGTRKNPKPFHFNNILVHLFSNYNVVVSRGGVEADDMICLHQSSAPPDTTIICSRDKDLRICPGWHFSWECGKQYSIGPTKTDEIGSIELIEKVSVNQNTGKVSKSKEIKGYGLKFFFSQMLTGDSADNIPGLPKAGVVAAYNLLNELETEEQMFKAVQGLYKETVGNSAKELFREQADLLWMRQKDKPTYRYKR